MAPAVVSVITGFFVRPLPVNSHAFLHVVARTLT